jgi:hypothetical protein
MFNKLTDTSLKLLEKRMRYRAMNQLLDKAQNVSAPRGGHLDTRDSKEMIHKPALMNGSASMNGAATVPGVLNGKQDHS